ncbi:MAG: response regulator [Prolixibacteraceae bacterium]
MIKALKLFIISAFLFIFLQSQASVPYKPTLADPVLEPWRWINFPEYDTIHISCLASGNEEGMWLGIGNKAVYYNGYKSTEFIPDSSNIQSLIYEKDNNLLVTTSNGLFRFREGKFRKILNFKFNDQRNFITDANQNVWIGSDHGLIRISSGKIYCLNPEGYFEISDNGAVEKIIRLEAANDYHLPSVLEINFPVYNLCLSNQQQAIFSVDLPNKNLGIINLENPSGNAQKWKYLNAPGIRHWDISGICATDNSLFITSSTITITLLQGNIAADTWETVNLKKLGGDNVQSSILKTSDGTIWIGGHSKLYSFKDSEWKVYQYPDVALPLSYIDISLDKNDRLYAFGSNGSLMKLDLSDKNFTTFSGLNFQCSTPDGRLWFTTNMGEVVVCDADRQNFQKYTTTDGLMNMTMSLHYSAKSGLWAAGSHNGNAAIARFQNKIWSLNQFPDLYLGIAYDGICELGDSAIAFPVNGLLELGNTRYRGGFMQFNYRNQSWKAVSRDRVPQRIPSIGQTSDGRLWFSGSELYVFNGQSTRPVDLPVKVANWTDDIAISATDHIWVAQGGSGLFHHDGKKWNRFSTFDGLASNMVTNILIDNDSTVYVASDKGISLFDGKQFITQIIHPDLNIQRERGFLRKSADGALWINQATREWYLYDFKNTAEDPKVFKTTMYRKENHAPKTTIFFSNQEISSSGNIIIAYSGIDFWNQTSSDKIQFSHRLNRGEWSPFTDLKSSVFLDLVAGDYTLEVRSRDLDGNIEPEPARISFSILPPVYRRAWFIFTILGFLGIIVWLLLRLYARNRQIHELDQLKLRLFTDISHELKTPLTLIALPLQKLLDKSTKQLENKDSLELIYTNVQRLSNLVNQVVDFRRLEAGKIQLELSPGDIVQHLRNIAGYYTPLAHEKNINFEINCNLQELWVKYDADKLEKIVVNLLSNAFKYTPENEKVELIVQIEQPNDKLQLWVNDSGPGIPKEMQQNIFDRFYRLRNEKATRIPGSGIGLSLVKELVSLHNGSIEVLSDGLLGTSFKVILPLIPAEKTSGASGPAKEIIDFKLIQSQEKATVLLIEDEEPMLRFVTAELNNYFKVKGVGSVEKAIEWLKTEMPDLIISDVMLPGLTGLEFCSRLKSDPLTSHLPVILLTARDSEEDIVEGLGTGADDYITKPFSMNELIARSYNLIENRRRQKDRFAEQEELEPETFAHNVADQNCLDKAIQLVFSNLDNPDFDVSQFCDGMNMSKTLLYSKLKALTGQSATEFVRNIRLKEAKKMLLNNVQQQTIAEISYRVGFNDPLYFSRCFRKYFGVPPSEIGR